MSTQYNVYKWLDGINGFGTQFCDTVYTATITESHGDTTLTVPGASAIGAVNASVNNKYIAVFSYESGVDVFVALNATAAVPAGDTFELSTSELNPTGKVVKAGDVIHMITAAMSADVSVALYTIQE